MFSGRYALLLGLLVACGRSHGADGEDEPGHDAGRPDVGTRDASPDTPEPPEHCADRDIHGPIATFDVGDETDLELVRVLGIPGDLASMLLRSRAEEDDGTEVDVIRYWVVGSGGRPVSEEWLGEPPESVVHRGVDLRADAAYIGHEYGKIVVIGRDLFEGELRVWLRWRDRGVWSELVELGRYPEGSLGGPTLERTTEALFVYWSREGELERRAFDFDAMSLGEPEPLGVAVGADETLVTRRGAEVVCVTARDSSGGDRLIEIRGASVTERALPGGASRALEPMASEGECHVAAPAGGVVPVPERTAGWTLPEGLEPFLLDLNGRPTSLLVGAPDGERASFWWVDAPDGTSCQLGEPSFEAAVPPAGSLPVAGTSSVAVPFGELLFVLGAVRPNGITTFNAAGEFER